MMTLIATLILALVVTLRYRTVVTELEREHLGAVSKIADGNYVSRTEVATTLSVPIEEPGFLARLGDSTFLASFFGKTSLYKCEVASNRAPLATPAVILF